MNIFKMNEMKLFLVIINKLDMNRNNINDLEALYFVDKVQMRSNSVSENKIPRLDFNIFNPNVFDCLHRNLRILNNLKV
jgi:hypothetical protein